MNKRRLLIVIALALPIIILVALTKPFHMLSHKGANATGRMPPATTLEEARERVRKRLAEVESIKPEDWAEERRIHPYAPPMREQAIQYNKKKLAELEAMTDAEWDAAHKPQVAQKIDPAELRRQFDAIKAAQEDDAQRSMPHSPQSTIPASK